MPKSPIDVERLREKLSYEPDTGLLYWKPGHGKRGWKGPAGCAQDNYLKIRIDDRLHLGHRVIWALVTGAWPDQFIDHIDRNPHNNRWSNLRLATNGQNMHNRPAQRNNTTGFKGVYRTRNVKNPWTSFIGVNRKYVHLGVFPTREEAAEAYKKAAERLFGEFASPL